MFVLITTYGDDTGPIMSKTLPTITKFSLATSQPIFGGLSVFMIILFDGVIPKALPIFCKFYSSENIKTNVSVHLKFSFLSFLYSEIHVFLAENLFNEKC